LIQHEMLQFVLDPGTYVRKQKTDRRDAKHILRLLVEGRFPRIWIPAARKPRIGPEHTVWNSALVKRILKNEKYIGKRIWNKTTQVEHPQTGKTETRKNPPQEWVHTEVSEIRIVSDELWNRVQERLKVVNEQMTPRRIAGMNRAKKREYIFSGLLSCGVCGSRITIGTSNAKTRSAAYRCPSET
jgi:hypothetical protein